jgi:hypothetical protein
MAGSFQCFVKQRRNPVFRAASLADSGHHHRVADLLHCGQHHLTPYTITANLLHMDFLYYFLLGALVLYAFPGLVGPVKRHR